ncbi:tetratricopeptide repeat protein [Ovoidimarina sediminis]|uniref:tetratricopeptide repeat protein n=1 Tax=Ovoidimarina sediminis TaxID=3079856 RepID=UPI0029090BC9|nr:tetratricopeptide repeat protein [Rhodophyticola sp. MJ-SS7]MDU8946351.1 tetratricopeptide repeat protein [Rhodophyticola sp. MJ-SS7]
MFHLSLFGRFSLTDASGVDVCVTSKKGKALLAYLAQTPGKPRSREEILALLWSDRAEAQGRASLRQVLTGLRKEVCEDFLLIDRDSVTLDLEMVELAPPNGEEFLSGFNIRDPAFEDWVRDERLRFGSPAAPREALDERDHSSDAKPAVAILPLQNMSGDAAQDYLADGMSVDIVTKLSRFRNIVVIGSWITSHFRGEIPKIEELEQKFGAKYVVTGSVRTSETQIRVSIHLIEVSSRETVWGESYNRDMADVFAVQDEITASIVRTIPGHIDLHHRGRPVSIRELNMSDYESLLKAEQCLRQGGRQGIRRARSLFQKVVEADPKNARALSGLARTYINEVWSDWADDESTLSECALRFAKEAVRLDPLDARAQINLGASYFFNSDFDKAALHFRQAQDLNPNDAEVFCFNGWCHALSGDFDATMSLTECSLALLLPQDSRDCYMARAIAAYTIGDFEGCLNFLNSVSSEEEDTQSLILSAACFERLGETNKAECAVTNFMSIAERSMPDFVDKDGAGWHNYFARMFPFRNEVHLKNLIEPLKRAGFPV